MKTNKYERGTYYVFDVQSWRKVTKELHLEYEMLEEKPQLPMSVLGAQAAAPQQQPPFASNSNFPSVAPFWANIAGHVIESLIRWYTFVATLSDGALIAFGLLLAWN